MERFSLREVVDAYVEEKLKTSKTPNPGRLRNVLTLFCYGYTRPEIREMLIRKYPNLTETNISRIIQSNRDKKIDEFRQIGEYLKENDLKPDTLLVRTSTLDRIKETPGSDVDLTLVPIEYQINVAPQTPRKERTIKTLAEEYVISPVDMKAGLEPSRVRLTPDLKKNQVGQFEKVEIEVTNKQGQREKREFEQGIIKKSHFLSQKRQPKDSSITKSPNIEYLKTKS